jgi:hypothetical protein
MKTLVFYQNPNAHHDIIAWSDSLALNIDPKKIQWEFEIEHKGGFETVSIFPIDIIKDLSAEQCLHTKLVLFGSFTHQDLTNILVSTVIMGL